MTVARRPTTFTRPPHIEARHVLSALLWRTLRAALNRKVLSYDDLCSVLEGIISTLRAEHTANRRAAQGFVDGRKAP